MSTRGMLIALALVGAVGVVPAAAAPQPSRASVRYHAFRQSNTIPPYSLKKVRALVHRLKEDPGGGKRLSEKAFNALSFDEKFTYTMIHAEDFDQNCDASPGIVSEEQKIFAYVPSAFQDVATWSDQQRAFLTANRGRVIARMRDTIRQQHQVGANFKQAIILLHASELIPDLAAVYKTSRKDHDILTVMMILMKDAKYGPFLKTSTYRKLFAEGATFGASIPATPANQKLFLDLADGFYQSTQHT